MRKLYTGLIDGVKNLLLDLRVRIITVQIFRNKLNI
jgi:hypothetical protein